MRSIAEQATERGHEVLRLIAALDELADEVRKHREAMEKALDSPLVELRTRFLHPRVYEALAIMKRGADKP